LAYTVGRLVVTTLDNDARHELLPGHTMVHFDLSADDQHIVFASGSDEDARRGIWIAPLDLTAAPRRVFNGETERVFFDRSENIYFLQRSGGQRHLHRLRAPDYKVNERAYPDRARYLFAASPDGEWIVGVTDRPDGRGWQQLAISTRGLPPRVICGTCGGGAGPARVMAPALSWTRDGHALLISGQLVAGGYGMFGPPSTIVIPVQPGAALPDLGPSGITSVEDYLRLPGARKIPRQNVLPGATPDQLFFYETTTIRNLYRVRLP
ncbi:MAG TPA: hypothetical protein VK864_19825, partial [Longimicrobiales bacterium]|nr:hypothetical protein [Longimicrobiales bacterium]